MDQNNASNGAHRRKQATKTSLEIIQEEMRRLSAPFGSVREMQNLLKLSVAETEMEELRKLYEPAWKLQELLEASRSSHINRLFDASSIALSARRMLEEHLPKKPFGFDEEALRRAAGIDVYADHLNAYRRILGPATTHREWLEKNSGIASLRQHYAGVSEQANSIIADIVAAKASLERQLASLGARPTLDAPTEDDERQASQAANDIAKKAIDQPTLEAAADQIFGQIKVLKNPVVQLILLTFFTKLLEAIFGAAIDAAVAKFSPKTDGHSRKEMTKSVIDSAQAEFIHRDLLTTYRFVASETLAVRQNPGARSSKIATLRFGTIVKLIKKDKDFALVYWRDKESDAEIQGWVFARHLRKFQ